MAPRVVEKRRDFERSGRITSGKTSPRSATASLAVTERTLVDVLGGAAAILDQLGTAGGILQLRMFEAWKDDVTQHRVVLKLMGIMPTVTALPSVAESARRLRSGRPTPENVRDLEYLAGRYQTLYHSTAPAAFMTPVVAHLSTLGDLLRQDPAPAERRRLLVNRARVGTLAGRLSFFDLHDPMAARATPTSVPACTPSTTRGTSSASPATKPPAPADSSANSTSPATSSPPPTTGASPNPTSRSSPNSSLSAATTPTRSPTSATASTTTYAPPPQQASTPSSSNAAPGATSPTSTAPQPSKSTHSPNYPMHSQRSTPTPPASARPVKLNEQTLPNLALLDQAPPAARTQPADRDHDTARGPGGPCSVAARSAGHRQLRVSRHSRPRMQKNAMRAMRTRVSRAKPQALAAHTPRGLRDRERFMLVMLISAPTPATSS